MALDVTVNISQAAVNGTLGFGMPLLLMSKASAAIAYTECKKLSEVATALGQGYADTDAYKAAQLIFAQANRPEAIAVCANTGDATAAVTAVMNKGWRQLMVFFGENDTKTTADVAALIEETNDKLYFITVSATSALSGLTNYKKTVAMIYPTNNNAVAALIGETAGREAGSFTYKNLILSGLTPLEPSSDTINQYHTAGALTVVSKAGQTVTSEGKSCGGEYIDIVDSKDWIIQNIEYDTQSALNNSSKIPYTDNGIAVLADITYNVLARATANGMIATTADGTPLFSVDFKKRSEMSASDRASRVYTGGNFEFTLAGAIHTVTINGELVI